MIILGWVLVLARTHVTITRQHTADFYAVLISKLGGLRLILIQILHLVNLLEVIHLGSWTNQEPAPDLVRLDVFTLSH